jgi:hypothetical protein
MTSPPMIGPMLAETSASMSIRSSSAAVDRVYRPSIGGDASGDARGRCYPSAAMAKRTRFPNRTSSRGPAKRPARPAGAAPARAPELTRQTAPPIDLDTSVDPFEDMPLRSSSSLTEAEVARAAQLEAEANAKERAAIAESLRRRARGEERALIDRGDINAPLSVRMAHEYAYVARDVRRILLTGGLMVAILAALAILINVLGVIKL